MSTQAMKSAKPSKPPNPAPPSMRSSSSLSSHLAMVELKQRILTSLSKLSDRDTYQIAVEDLEKIIQSLSPETLPMFLNCLYESSNDPKPAVKKESIRLLSFVCQTHGDLASTHLTKIIAHIVRRLKDADSGVKDACRDAVGALSAQYLKGKDESNGGSVSLLGLFVKPLFEAMGEQNKGVQSGAAVCMARMVECSVDPPVTAFQKLCPRICKLLNNPNFLAKASLLSVVGSLCQVGAITPQSMEPLLQSIHESLGSTDWATRKASAEALSSLALHSSSLVIDKGASTLTLLDTCRFDKIKPVRDSITEALQLWKKLFGEGGDGSSDDQKASSPPSADLEKNDVKNSNHGERTEAVTKDSSRSSSPSSLSISKGKCGNISEKAVVILKKKAPALSDKELNPEFFQKLETRGSDDLPVEVVVPRRSQNISNSSNDEQSDPNELDSRGRSNCMENNQTDVHGSLNSKFRNVEKATSGLNTKQRDYDFVRDKWPEERASGKDLRTRVSDDARIEVNQRESSGNSLAFPKADAQAEGSINNKGNWSAIQRQLLLLERQQAHLMNMLQEFMGGSHDSMVTLENRVRGLERIVEDMARDLSISSGRRSNNGMGFEGSNRSLGKFNGYPDYPTGKYNGRIPFGERFNQSDGIASSMRGRGPTWRSDVSEEWDFPAYAPSRNGQVSSRRMHGSGPPDGRSLKPEHDSDQVSSSRRAWEKGPGPVRLGEGPSARSVWQASKDEATLEAIRVAGEDSGTSRAGRVAIPEMTAEAMGDDSIGQERDPIWNSWSNAMHALRESDMDSAYAEVGSTGDDLLLVKLMDKTGPVIDQLSNEIANEVMQAIGQFLLDHSLFDICLSWIQQLIEVVMENGPNVFGIPLELRKEILLNFHEASSAIDPPEDWEGPTPDQLLMQLASGWDIELQQFDK